MKKKRRRLKNKRVKQLIKQWVESQLAKAQQNYHQEKKVKRILMRQMILLQDL
jgi:ribosomal protein L4